jgi:hypothetical protein
MGMMSTIILPKLDAQGGVRHTFAIDEYGIDPNVVHVGFCS